MDGAGISDAANQRGRTGVFPGCTRRTGFDLEGEEWSFLARIGLCLVQCGQLRNTVPADWTRRRGHREPAVVGDPPRAANGLWLLHRERRRSRVVSLRS